MRPQVWQVWCKLTCELLLPRLLQAAGRLSLKVGGGVLLSQLLLLPKYCSAFAFEPIKTVHCASSRLCCCALVASMHRRCHSHRRYGSAACRASACAVRPAVPWHCMPAAGEPYSVCSLFMQCCLVALLLPPVCACMPCQGVVPLLLY
ncbi:hypothetical protein COO60DRAFT_966365 [Scenedesmus sp. NREL 46B-D3]|nr:hypothetical protein COO60DRAFT_966365 [Scenedesmus sp. NREL 46B-D3]